LDSTSTSQIFVQVCLRTRFVPRDPGCAHEANRSPCVEDSNRANKIKPIIIHECLRLILCHDVSGRCTSIN